MYTEEQAKFKSCPIAKYAVDKEGNFHSPHDPNGVGRLFCLASGCMMWEWDHEGMCTKCIRFGDGCECEAPAFEGYCGLTRRPA